jgi:hypothetical protein
MDPPHPVPGVGDGTMVDRVDAELVRTVVEAAGAESGSSLLSVEFRQLGGALDRPRPGDGIASFAGSSYAVFAVGMAITPEMHAANERQASGIVAALEQWESEQIYMNFRESRVDGARLFPKGTYERLQAVKRAVDPDDVIRSNHPIT